MMSYHYMTAGFAPSLPPVLFLFHTKSHSSTVAHVFASPFYLINGYKMFFLTFESLSNKSGLDLYIYVINCIQFNTVWNTLLCLRSTCTFVL